MAADPANQRLAQSTQAIFPLRDIFKLSFDNIFNAMRRVKSLFNVSTIDLSNCKLG